MKKKFRLIAGRKFFCDEKGVLNKDTEGNYQEVPEDEKPENLEEVTPEGEASQEAEKMLSEVMAKVKDLSATGVNEAQVKANDALAKLFNSIAGNAGKALKVAGEGSEPVFFVGKTKAGADDVKKGLTELYARQRSNFTFTVRSVEDLKYLAKTTSEGESLEGDVIPPQIVPEISRDPVRSVFIESISDVTPNMTSDALSYVECVTESGAPLTTAELADISEKDFEFQEFKATLKKIAVINKHSVEILQDAPQLVSAIRGWLQEDVNIVTDQQLLNGNGLGDNLTGVMTVASVLDATSIGTKRVEFANLADVIRVAITKIAVAGKGKFSASYVLLNPTDADALDLTKDENGQYILPPFKSTDGTTIKGARIIENVGVPEGDFLVGDFRKLHIGTKGGVEIEMTNSDGNDFSKDILSIKLRRRVAAYVRQNDDGAFWTGDIADCIAALTQS
jgi:HK97 family phage major capsid protein